MRPDPSRVIEARALAAIAVIATRRLPTFIDVQTELHGVTVEELTQALDSLARRGKVAVETYPSQESPLFGPRTVCYRPVALVAASSLLPITSKAGASNHG